MVTCNSTLSSTHWHVDPIAGSLTLHTLGWIICIACTLISSIVSFYLIYKHATTFTNLNEQRNIIRILLMVPVYSVTTMFSYVWYWHAVYWEFARDCYEAFAIAAFFSLMCHYIAPELREQKEFFAAMDVRPWPWPATSFNKCTHGKWRKPRSGLTWFNIVWVSIFQYCFVRIATTIIATTTQYTGHFCEDSLHPAFAHFWVMLFNCLSVTVAMYMLITFYLNTRDQLAPKKPLIKMLCIKLVVFFCFWQMIILDFLGSAHIIKPTNKISPGDISVGFNALLVCFEMVIFSIMHLFAFPWNVYQSSSLGPGPIPTQTPPIKPWKALAYSFNPFDMIKAIARGVKWALFGYRRRHQQASDVAARKDSKIQFSEEGQGLVSNAVLPGTYPKPNVYDQPAIPGGLVVQHPSPSDQEPIPQ
ncbi:organic solute transporter Ostalpha-domain-containing protein, partial [Trichophaea hybrida]